MIGFVAGNKQNKEVSFFALSAGQRVRLMCKPQITMNPKLQNLEAFYVEDLFAIYESAFPELLSEFFENKEYSRFRDFLFRSKENPTLPENPDKSNRLSSKAMVNAGKIRKAKQYVEVHYDETIRLKDVADIVGFEESTFSHFFKQNTGQTFITYLNAFRVEHACLLLQETDKTVTEIGYDVGFNTSHSFNEAFKKNKKTTPEKYRKLCRKNY